MTRIALDAMGGDNAPGEIVRGGVEAAESLADVKVLLVGVQSQIEAVQSAVDDAYAIHCRAQIAYYADWHNDDLMR